MSGCPSGGPLGAPPALLGAPSALPAQRNAHFDCLRRCAKGVGGDMDVYVQLEHGEDLRSITFKGRVRLHVDFNAIGPVVAVEPIDGAVVIEAEADELPKAV